MTLTLPTNEQLLADIRRRLEQGETAATAERIKSLAADSSDVELLRGMADALADAVIKPASRKRGRPKTRATIAAGVIDLDAMPARTGLEQAEHFRAWVKEWGKAEKAHELHTKRRVSIATACQRIGIGTDTYYKWYAADY